MLPYRKTPLVLALGVALVATTPAYGQAATPSGSPDASLWGVGVAVVADGGDDVWTLADRNHKHRHQPGDGGDNGNDNGQTRTLDEDG